MSELSHLQFKKIMVIFLDPMQMRAIALDNLSYIFQNPHNS